MITKLRVVSQADFDKWLIDEADSASLPLAERGKKLFNMKCTACHYADKDMVKIGPSLKGLFGRDVETFDDKKFKADENYIRQSILEPQAVVVKGFGERSSMTPFQGQLSEKEVLALIEFIKSNK